MPVHLMGKTADMDAIKSIVGQYGLYVIEDAAEAHGVLYKGKSVGGLFAAVGAWRTSRQERPRLVRLGAPDALMLGNPEREELRRRINCDAESIAEACRTT